MGLCSAKEPVRAQWAGDDVLVSGITYWGYIGIMEKTMETTKVYKGFGFRVWGLRELRV